MLKMLGFLFYSKVITHMCQFSADDNDDRLILTPEQEEAILEVAMAVNNQKEDGTFYRYVSVVSGHKPQREFCKRMILLDKLYSKADIAQMSFRGINKEFGHKRNNYSLFKHRGGKHCKHAWMEVEIIFDEDGLPHEYKRAMVDTTPVGAYPFATQNNINTMKEGDEIFEFVYDPEKMEGIWNLSLVADPAIQVEMMKFSNDVRQDWKFSSEEKRVIVSPVVIPNQYIWRNDIQGSKGWVFFSEETIEKLQQNFAKEKYGHNSSIEHDEVIDNVYVTESWIVTDPLNDKANALGFKDIKKGTWFVSQKIDNDAVWEKCKDGTFAGISIDAMLGSKRVTESIKFNMEINTNKKTNIKMDRQTITDIINEAISKVALAADLNEFKVSDELSYFASNLDMGSIVTTDAGELLIDTAFEIDGVKYLTDKMGALIEVPADEAPVEDIPAAEAVEVELEDVPADVAPIEEVPAVEDTQVLKDQLLEMEAKIAEQDAMIADLESKNVKLEADLVLIESQKVEMSNETPASEGIKDVPMIEDDKVAKKGLLETLRKLNK